MDLVEMTHGPIHRNVLEGVKNREGGREEKV